ncbi:MAG: hypothetical protein AB7G34_07230, partial [Hyphomicrobiales bacterium]
MTAETAERINAERDRPAGIALAARPASGLGTSSRQGAASGQGMSSGGAAAPHDAHQEAAPPAPRRFGLKRGEIAGVARTVGLGALSLFLGVAWWHWATSVDLDWYINFENVPAPLAVWQSFVAQLAGSEFYIHVAVSMRRILIGYALA